MPIEFRCTQCNRLLRTGEETAGKRAKCPECGTIMTIPAAAMASEQSPAPPPPPPPAGPAGGPFGIGGRPQAGFDPENPYAAPSQYAPAPAAYPVAAGEITPTIIRFGDVFAWTWAVFAKQWAMCLAVVILALIIAVVGACVLAGAPFFVGLLTRNIAIAVLGAIVGCLLAFVFTAWIGIGAIKTILGIARGEEADLGKLFSGASHLIPVFLAGLLQWLISVGILLACALPGLMLTAVSPKLGGPVIVAGVVLGYVVMFVVMLMLSQAIFLIIDRNMGVIESLSTSMAITRGNKLTLFLVWLVLAIVGEIVIFLTCGLGIFVVVPYQVLLYPVMYLAMTGQPTAYTMPPGYAAGGA